MTTANLPAASIARLCQAIADQYGLDPMMLFERCGPTTEQGRICVPDSWRVWDDVEPAAPMPLFCGPALLTFKLSFGGAHLLVRYRMCDACHQRHRDDRAAFVPAPTTRDALVSMVTRCAECRTPYVNAAHAADQLTLWFTKGGDL